MRVLAHTIVGGLTGGLAGAAGAATGTLTAPNVAAALNKAGVDPDLARELTGLSSTLAGAAVGGTAGGSAAYNEVVNNFLGHADRERLNKLREKALSKERLTKAEAEQLAFLEISDHISDGLLAKYRSGQPLTKFEQQNLAIYLGGYAQQNGEEATRKLVQNGSTPAYGYPYAGSSSDRSAYANKNFTWWDYWYRNNQSSNELIFNDARAQAGIYPNVTPYESLTPVGLQLSRLFSVVDSIANSSMAAGTYLGATALGASAETRDGLTIAMGQLAQIGAAFMLPRTGISPVFGTNVAEAYNSVASAGKVSGGKDPANSAAQGAKEISSVTPTVTAKGTVNGTVFEDVNQTAKVGASNEPTLIADRIAAKVEAQGKPFPNGTVADSHAEIGVIQQAYSAGKTQGAEMSMSVAGKDVCGFCKGDIAAAANAAGLKSLTIKAVDDITGLPKTYYWQPGMKSIKEKP